MKPIIWLERVRSWWRHPRPERDVFLTYRATTTVDAVVSRVVLDAPLFDLTGKVALITGGSRGLGYQMAKAFAAQGADLFITSRKLDACEAVDAQLARVVDSVLARGGVCIVTADHGNADEMYELDKKTQQPAQTPGRKRKTVLSPELREVLHMLKSLETKPAQG